MERVSTYGLGQTMIQSAMSLQSRLSNAEVQQSSGLKSGSYTGLGVASERLVSLESTLAVAQTRSDAIAVVTTRVESMYSAVGDMIDKLTSLRSTLTTAMSDTDNNTDYETIGSDLLDDLADLMNLHVEGRYLFSGSQTTTAPVDVTALASPPSGVDTSYYQGDTSLASVRVSDQLEITYGVSGDDSGFELALRAANLVSTISTGTTDSSAVNADSVSDAYDLAVDAIEALTTLQSTLSLTAARLESAQTLQDNAVTTLANEATNVKAVDTAEVAVQISQLQTSLEASYSALSNMTKMSLADFL